MGELITAHSVGDGEADSGDENNLNESKDEEESTLEDEPPAKKKKPDEPGKDKNPLITKLTKTLQLTEHVAPAIDGDLASPVENIMGEKANEDKLTELKKQYETPENCTTLSETKVNPGVWNNLDESARSTDLKFQKVQKSLIKGVIVIVSEVNKLMGSSGRQEDDTVSALMDGVLLLANANQELNYRRRELMRPQLNANYSHLCSPSTPVTAKLFGDDLPKAVKDISDTNRLSAKLIKDSSSHRHSKSGQRHTFWHGKNKYGGARNSTHKQSKNSQSPLHFRRNRRGRRRATKLNPRPMQVCLTTKKFAGRLRHFIPAWMSLTADENILDTVQHCHFESGNPDQPRPRPEMQKLLICLNWVLLSLLYIV